jgi:hypothetical protein
MRNPTRAPRGAFVPTLPVHLARQSAAPSPSRFPALPGEGLHERHAGSTPLVCSCAYGADADAGLPRAGGVG